MLDPSSETARYRLGLMALHRQAFGDAVELMQPAYEANSDHRGLSKALGYALVWQGRIEDSTPLLAKIPEARSELNTYAWWWKTQGRTDLSRYAEIESDRLSMPSFMTSP